MLLNDTRWEIRQEMKRQGIKPGAMGAEKIDRPGVGIWRHNAEFKNIAFPLISPMEIRYHVGIINQLYGAL